MRYVDSYEIHRRARVLRARAIHAALRGIARGFGRWSRRLGSAGLQARRALRLAG